MHHYILHNEAFIICIIYLYLIHLHRFNRDNIAFMAKFNKNTNIVINSTTGDAYVIDSLTATANLISVDTTTLHRNKKLKNKYKKKHWLVFFDPIHIPITK